MNKIIENDQNFENKSLKQFPIKKQNKTIRDIPCIVLEACICLITDDSALQYQNLKSMNSPTPKQVFSNTSMSVVEDVVYVKHLCVRQQKSGERGKEGEEGRKEGRKGRIEGGRNRKQWRRARNLNINWL